MDEKRLQELIEQANSLNVDALNELIEYYRSINDDAQLMIYSELLDSVELASEPEEETEYYTESEKSETVDKTATITELKEKMEDGNYHAYIAMADAYADNWSERIALYEEAINILSSTGEDTKELIRLIKRTDSMKNYAYFASYDKYHQEQREGTEYWQNVDTIVSAKKVKELDKNDLWALKILEKAYRKGLGNEKKDVAKADEYLEQIYNFEGFHGKMMLCKRLQLSNRNIDAKEIIQQMLLNIDSFDLMEEQKEFLLLKAMFLRLREGDPKEQFYRWLNTTTHTEIFEMFAMYVPNTTNEDDYFYSQTLTTSEFLSLIDGGDELLRYSIIPGIKKNAPDCYRKMMNGDDNNIVIKQMEEALEETLEKEKVDDLVTPDNAELETKQAFGYKYFEIASKILEGEIPSNEIVDTFFNELLSMYNKVTDNDEYYAVSLILPEVMFYAGIKVASMDENAISIDNDYNVLRNLKRGIEKLPDCELRSDLTNVYDNFKIKYDKCLVENHKKQEKIQRQKEMQKQVENKLKEIEKQFISKTKSILGIKKK